MIVVSALLVLVALVTFVIGVFADESSTMIWASIASSLLAAITLMIGVMRGRRAQPEMAGDTVTVDLPHDTTEAPTLEQTLLPVRTDLEQDVPETAEPADEPEEISVPAEPLVPEPSRAKTAAKKSAAKKPAAKKPAAKKPAAKKPAAKPASAGKKTAKAAPAKKTAAKSAKPAPAKSAAAKTAKPAPAKKTAAKKTAAKKPAAKPSQAKKTSRG